MNRPSRKDPSRFGASRKSSAERDGGVSTTMRSHGPSRVGLGAQLAELLHRHVLLRARERAGDRLVEGVGEDLGGLLGGGVRSTTSSKVRFMSSIIASSEPPPRRRRPATGRGVLSSSVSPSDWASRRAGSMVRTTTLAARARPPAARARRRSSSCRRRPSRSRRRCRVPRSREERVDVESGRAAGAAAVAAAGRRRRCGAGPSATIPCSRSSVGEHARCRRPRCPSRSERQPDDRRPCSRAIASAARARAPTRSACVRRPPRRAGRRRRCRRRRPGPPRPRGPRRPAASVPVGPRPQLDRRPRRTQRVAHLVDDDGAEPAARGLAARRSRRRSPAPASPRAASRRARRSAGAQHAG